MLRRLPFTPKAQSGESPLSVLRRGALGNGHKSTLRFTFSVNSSLGHGMTALNTLARNPEIFRTTALGIGLTSTEVNEISYKRVGSGKQDDVVWNGFRIPLEDLQFKRTKMCMACYQEYGYALAIWDHVACLACPEHRILLDDACPCCGAMWVSARDPLACGCSPEEIIAHQQLCSTRTATTLQRVLNEQGESGLQLIGQMWRVLKLWRAMGVALDKAEISDALAALGCGIWPTSLSKNNGTPLHPRLALMPLIAANNSAYLSAASELLIQRMPLIRAAGLSDIRWPSNVAQAILGIGRMSFAKLLGDGHIAADRGGRFSAKALNDLLWLVAGATDADPSMMSLRYIRGGRLRLSLTSVVGMIKSGAITNHHCNALSGLSGLHCTLEKRLPLGSVKIVDVQEAATRLSTNAESVRRAIALKLLPATKGTPDSAVQWSIDAHGLESFDSMYVFASAIARQHGAPIRAIASRLRSVGLEPVSGPGIDGGATFLFRRCDVSRIDLAAALSDTSRSLAGQKQSALNKTATAQKLVTSHEAAHELGVSQRQLREVVRSGWISPHITPRRHLFEKNEVLALRHRLGVDFIHLKKAAHQLDQTEAQFRKTWIMTGVIRANRFADRWLIESAALDRIKDIWRHLGSASSVGAALNRHRWLCPNLTKMGRLPSPTRMGTGPRHVRLYPRGTASVQRYAITYGNWYRLLLYYSESP